MGLFYCVSEELTMDSIFLLFKYISSPSSQKSRVYEKVSPNGRRHPQSAVRLGTQSEYAPGTVS